MSIYLSLICCSTKTSSRRMDLIMKGNSDDFVWKLLLLSRLLFNKHSGYLVHWVIVSLNHFQNSSNLWSSLICTEFWAALELITIRLRKTSLSVGTWMCETLYNEISFKNIIITRYPALK